MLHHQAHLAPKRLGALLLLVALLFGFATPAPAQSDAVYFQETGHYLQGTFRVFWETNGSVDIFGLPITEEYVATDTGRVTQYFERARFELTELDGRSLVALGRLGIEYTEGRTFPKVPPITNTSSRRYFPETQHVIQYGFKEIWETRGGLSIFGFPISEEIYEVLSNGRWHTVQYFERVRFEYWPEFPPGKRVLISSLGRELAPATLTAPLPPGAAPGAPVTQPAPAPTPVSAGAPIPTATPVLVPVAPPNPNPVAPPNSSIPPDTSGGSAPVLVPLLPASVNALVIPDSGPPGTTFR
ncbi:MAG: hypothetical protein HC837_13795, partial [Chloroflexaceae bacterium]|nr:hypothetical protein [Chloroflexaceae bacterium]